MQQRFPQRGCTLGFPGSSEGQFHKSTPSSDSDGVGPGLSGRVYKALQVCLSAARSSTRSCGHWDMGDGA